MEERFELKINELSDEVCKLKGFDSFKTIISRDHICQLEKENAELKSENAALKHKVDYTTLVMSDLNTKLKLMEEEKRSLVTALKLIQSDLGEINNSVNNKGADPSNTNHQKNSSPSSEVTILTSSNDEDICPLVNQYSALTVQDDTAEEEEANKSTQQSQPQIEATGYSQQSGSHISMKEKDKKDDNTRQDAPIMLIGDSIIKDIIPGKLSKKDVKKCLYSGKTAEEISHKLDHIRMDPSPSHVIIHVGTNNLPTDSGEDTARKVEQLAEKVKNKFPLAKVAISSIIVREDKDVKEKLKTTNEYLGQVCSKQNFSFINNSNIDYTALNNSNLHLNSKGTAYLAVNFIKFIRNDTVRKQVDRRQSINDSSYQDFQPAQLLQLGNLLTTLALSDPRHI